MDTRLNKYNNDNRMSRVAKNEDLYKEINDSELDNFNVRSNATVIGNQEPEIDVEKIKKILDKKYNEAPKRRSIRIEPMEETSKVAEEDTKEYDITKVIAKAKDEKNDLYETDRAKKLRDTQYDILNNLNISEEPEKKEDKTSEEDLMELINTITLNEAKKHEEEANATDLLEDLKGNDNTEVYESMSQEIKEITEASSNTSNEIIEATPTISQAEKVLQENKSTIDNSFYTHNLFKKRDFEDDGSKEFVEDNNLNIGIKILIVLVVICFLIGLFLFLKSFLNF